MVERSLLHLLLNDIDRANSCAILRATRQVLALLHPYPQRQSTWEPLLDGFTLDNSLVQNHRPGTEAMIAFGTAIIATQVHIPQIITAEEFEILETLLQERSLSLPTLLDRKIRNVQTRFVSMKNHLLSFEQVTEQANEHMLQLYNTVIDAIRHKWGVWLNLVPPAREEGHSATTYEGSELSLTGCPEWGDSLHI